jgi:hypothetical protein
MTQSDTFHVERKLVTSKAFLSLKTPSAHKVFMIFYLKRQMKDLGRGKRGKKENWVCVNNGDLVFTYKEAEGYGMSAGQFSRAIDDLREKGFLDINESGSGVYRYTNKYFLSERWRKYGTPEYEKPKPRKKGPIIQGFQKGNQLGKNCREKRQLLPTSKAHCYG